MIKYNKLQEKPEVMSGDW